MQTVQHYPVALVAIEPSGRRQRVEVYRTGDDAWRDPLGRAHGGAYEPRTGRRLVIPVVQGAKVFRPDEAAWQASAERAAARRKAGA